jgi:hypothetical protein
VSTGVSEEHLHLQGRKISRARNHRETRWQAEPSVDSQRTTWCYIPGDSTLQSETSFMCFVIPVQCWKLFTVWSISHTNISDTGSVSVIRKCPSKYSYNKSTNVMILYRDMFYLLSYWLVNSFIYFIHVSNTFKAFPLSYSYCWESPFFKKQLSNWGHPRIQKIGAAMLRKASYRNYVRTEVILSFYCAISWELVTYCWATCIWLFNQGSWMICRKLRQLHWRSYSSLTGNTFCLILPEICYMC